MKVRMLVSVVDDPAGVDWPAEGETVDLPEVEAVDLVAAGLAEPVAPRKRAARK